MKDLYNTREIINESFSVIFPKKAHNISFKKRINYSEEVKEKLVQLECDIAAVQDLVSTNPNIVVGNSDLDAIIEKLYFLIKKIELIKQNNR